MTIATRVLRMLMPLSMIAMFVVPVRAQNSAPPPVTFTADQDHQNMMDQLGIKALRPGPSGTRKRRTTRTMTSRRRIRIPMCRTR
jgi:hypothetical protein